MNNNDIQISIIIINYNTKTLTRQCINSILSHTKGITYEIILVDNNSTDGSINEFCNDPTINFIETKKNLGFGKGNNIGIQNAKGKYVFLLNSDTLLRNNAIKILFDFYTEHKNERIGAVGTLLEDFDGNICHSFGPLPTPFKTLWHEIQDHIYHILHLRKPHRLDNCKNKDLPYFDVDYITGADLLIEKKIFKEIGGAFDPDFFMYSEEMELEYRMKKKKLTRYIIKGPRIVHLEGQSTSKLIDTNIRKILMYQCSTFLYYKKTNSKFVYKLFRLIFPFFRIHFLFKRSWTRKDKYTYFRYILFNKQQ